MESILERTTYRNYEIVILDNMSRGTTRNLENALKDERVKLIQGDIRDIPIGPINRKEPGGNVALRGVTFDTGQAVSQIVHLTQWSSDSRIASVPSRSSLTPSPP